MERTANPTNAPKTNPATCATQATPEPGSVTNWNPSTLLFTSATAAPNGTLSLTYRIDWFENEPSFGILLTGEEIGVGTFDPMLGTITLEQTGGVAPEVLDQYQVTYDPDTRALVNGSWQTGTFSGAHELSGQLLGPLQASATSTRGSLVPANAVDTNM